MRRFLADWLTIIVAAVIITFGMTFFIWRSASFEHHCSDLGGSTKHITGTGYMLCVSPDGRLLDEGR